MQRHVRFLALDARADIVISGEAYFRHPLLNSAGWSSGRPFFRRFRLLRLIIFAPMVRPQYGRALDEQH